MNLSVNSISGNLDIQNGQLVLIEGQEEIKQHLAQRLRTFLSEWFLDQALGLPYFDDILKKNVIGSEVESIFIEEIVKSPGVVRLLQFDLTLSKGLRRLELSFMAETIDGIIEFNSEVP